MKVLKIIMTQLMIFLIFLVVMIFICPGMGVYVSFFVWGVVSHWALIGQLNERRRYDRRR